MKSDKSLEKFFKFLEEADELKYLERFKGHVNYRDYEPPARYESVADHTWRVMLMIFTFADEMKDLNLDLQRTYELCLIHDLNEIYAGDMAAQGKNGWRTEEEQQTKERLEADATKKILDMLPESVAARYHELDEEYKAQKSNESRVVRALDALEGKMTAIRYTKGKFYKSHYEFTLQYGKNRMGVSGFLDGVYDAVVEKMKSIFQEIPRKEPADE